MTDALTRARRLDAAVRRAQERAATALSARDEAIRAAVAEHGVRPVARALGLDPSLISRISRR